MKLEFLRLQHFRNLSFAEFNPDLHLNLFVGKNAQGKTSILEAIHALSHLESFRKGKPADLIQYGRIQNKVQANLVLEVEGERWESHHEVSFLKQDPNERVMKRAQIDGKPVNSATQYLLKRKLQTISFNPSDHELVQGDPKIRRAYLNHSVSSEDVAYLAALKRFNQALAQRNEALKSERSDLQAWLETFTPIFVECAAQVLLGRLKWLKRLQSRINRKLSAIAPRQEPLYLRYSSSALSISVLELEKLDLQWSLSDLQSELLEQLRKKASAERVQKASLVGPHRDDWWFEMSQKPLKNAASQGEIRSALLALKLSEIELFLDTTRVKPVVLLDDFSSELDFERREFLLRYLQDLNLQTFVTTTENLSWFGKRFEVVSGTVHEPSAHLNVNA